MNATKFNDVVKMARENSLTVLVRNDNYVLCDEQLHTLVTTHSLDKLAWFINNCEILGIVKV